MIIRDLIELSMELEDVLTASPNSLHHKVAKQDKILYETHIMENSAGRSETEAIK